jgi:hypothetical protein
MTARAERGCPDDLALDDDGELAEVPVADQPVAGWRGPP